ncbi:MAG: TetR/AcrR family transcriptional regulator [Caldisericia bacterium]|jgi:AcrR family transcriptional regulator|nr:TetR/AcrR family transcriptional regulator [Caldisericia bacterium]
MNKDIIFEKCKEYILEKGFENFEIRGLVKSLGISIGTFYNYFKSKEDLFCQIFLDDWNKTLKEIENSIKNKEFEEKVEITLKNLRVFLEKYKTSMKVIFNSLILKGEKPKKLLENVNLINFVKENFEIKDDYLAELFINLIFFHLRRGGDDKKFINLIKRLFEEDLWKK